MPWGDGNRAPRTVTYTRSSGVFVVCVWCWPKVSGAQLLQYAATLVLELWPASGVPFTYCAQRWPAIRDAHLEVKPVRGEPRRPEQEAALDDLVLEHEDTYHPGRACRENQFGACEDRFGDNDPWS